MCFFFLPSVSFFSPLLFSFTQRLAFSSSVLPLPLFLFSSETHLSSPFYFSFLSFFSAAMCSRESAREESGSFFRVCFPFLFVIFSSARSRSSFFFSFLSGTHFSLFEAAAGLKDRPATVTATERSRRILKGSWTFSLLFARRPDVQKRP